VRLTVSQPKGPHVGLKASVLHDVNAAITVTASAAANTNVTNCFISLFIIRCNITKSTTDSSSQ